MNREGCRRVRSLVLAATSLAHAPLAVAAIALDGRLDEPEWERAQLFTDFRVKQPYTLGEPRHPTEVRLLGTPDGIIIGFRCAHPAETPRQKEQTPRDADNNGDRVNVYIDFDADAQVAYQATFALAGSLQDGTVTNENVYNTDWDGDIAYAVRDAGDEWFVEVLLPWTLAPMKHPGVGRRTIAVAFDRVLGVTQERSALEGVSFNLPRYLSVFPKVEIDQFRGSLLHAFPYASATSDWLHDSVDLKLGADVLWKPSGSLQLAAALNPDFGQVEADELVVNFDAIEVLFTDRRPFFTENQSLFDVRPSGTFDRLLYTRRVGGPRDDDPQRAAEIDAAVKLTGSVGRLDYGVFTTAERDYGDDLGRAFAAQRLRYGVGPWTLGVMSTWTDRPFLDRSAQVHSGDFIWRPDARFVVQGQLLGSVVDTTGAETSGGGQAVQANFTPSPEWQHELRLVHFDRDLDFNDLGFQTRPSVRKAGYTASRRFRGFAPEDPRAAVLWRLIPELRWNDAGERLGHYLAFTREARQRSGALLNTMIEYSFEGIDDLISRGNGSARQEPRLLGLLQDYQSARIGRWRTYAAAKLLQEGNEDYALQAESKLEYFARDDFNVALRGVMLWSRDWLIWQEANLLASFRRTRALLAGDLNWFPAPSQELRVKLQWLAIDARDPIPFRIAADGALIESADPVEGFQVNNFGVQLRYRWTFAPQSDLYVVYGRGGIVFERDSPERDLGGLFSTALDLRDSDQFIAKVRYRF